MRPSPQLARISIAALLSLLAPGAILAAEPEIHLEGTGDARASLDALSYKPFDAAVLSKLTDWTGGEALTADSMKGKVVLLVTWSSWYKTSFDALRIAQSLNAKHADKGLIVVGVHHKDGWGKAGEVAKTHGVEFRTALDKTGEFRKAMFSTQDPDCYLVDRAGRLRFADIETRSVEAATDLLVAETAEQAAAATAPAASAAKSAEAPAAEADGAAPPAAAGDYKQPPADQYAAAKWPKHNTGDLSAKNFQGKPLPRPLGKEKYLAPKPDRAGRVTVVDFWATWCGPCRQAMPILDTLQKSNTEDLVVIGLSDEPEATIKTFLKKNPHGYAQAVDPSRTLNNALQIQGIPHVIIVSSDGVIRWQGHPATPDFKKAVAECIAVDPGVKARKAASKG